MALLSVVSCFLTLLAGFGFTSAATRCSQLMRNGYPGQCVDKGAGCPLGYVEFPMYSNYVGCVTTTQMCCVALPPTTTATTTQTTTISSTKSPRLLGNCGTGSADYFDKIYNGVLTSPCDWPFVVSIRSLLAGETTLTYSTTGHVCQGVLIGQEWVLTSANCALLAAGNIADAATNILVVASEYNVTRWDINPSTGLPQEQLIGVSQVFLHPAYTQASQLDNDIALLKLQSSISGKCSNFICLPSSADASNTCKGYNECVITGWGFTSQDTIDDQFGGLFRGSVSLVSKEGCDLVTQRMSLNRPVGAGCLYPNDLLNAGCEGDEGGAVMCYDGQRWTVRAILPVAYCLDSQFSFFPTDVNQYLDWVNVVVASNGGF